MPVSSMFDVCIQDAAELLGATPHHVLMLGLSGEIQLYRAIPSPEGVATVFVIEPDRPEEKVEIGKVGVCLKPLIDLEILEIIESGQLPSTLYVDRDELNELAGRQTWTDPPASSEWASLSAEQKKAAWVDMTPGGRRALVLELVEMRAGNKSAVAREIGISPRRVRQLLDDVRRVRQLLDDGGIRRPSPVR